jgi:hypothetical protein
MRIDMRSRPAHLPPCLTLSFALALLARDPAAAQITTENAGVISPELTILRESVSVARSANLDEVGWEQRLIFAPDRAHEFRLSVPVLRREARFDTPGGEAVSDESGLGDVSLRFKQALFRADDVMRSERWALLLDLTAPTGEHDAEVNGTPVPRPLQLGTGAWGFGAGGAYTWIADRQRAALEATVHHVTRHDGIQLGASAELNAAYWYRFVPAAFDLAHPGTEIRGVLELLGSYHFATEVGDDLVDDDGPLLQLAPGIQIYPGTHVLFEANVLVPLYQDIDDALGDRHWSANLILKFLF